MEKKSRKKHYHDLIFIAFILIYVIILSIEAVHLPSKASLFPKIIIAIVLVLGILKIISIVSSKFSSYIEPPSFGSVIKEEFSKKLLLDEEKKEKPIIDNTAIIIWSWIIALLVSFYFFGILASTAIGLFIFIFVIGKYPLITSFTISIGTILFIYILFIVILRIRVFEGILFL
jgi:hypothetical protein